MPGHARVLVVDDDPGIRLLCRVNLQLDGHAVEEAASLADARATLDRGWADVVLLDLHVAGEDGRALLDELRAAHPGVPVALLTGAAEPVRGADAVIAKPFTLDELRETVGALSDRAGADGAR